MRRLALIAIPAAVLAALALAFAWPRGRATRPLVLRAPATVPLVGVAFEGTFVGGRSAVLHRLDPRTLRALGNGVPLGSDAIGWSVSPDRSRFAAGDFEHGEIVLVDLSPLRRLGLVRTGVRGTVDTTAWVDGRLLAVIARHCRSCRPELVTIDPASWRVLARHTLAGTLEAAGTAPHALVLLLRAGSGIGPSTLAVARADGTVGTAALDRLASGTRPLRNGREIAHHAIPGLAVDAAHGRAYVVGAGTPVAEVDLGTLAVGYHELARPTSALGVLRNWLDPAASAKGLAGPERTARWLGDGVLAVWGRDDHGSTGAGGNPTFGSTAAGLELIDTRDWGIRVLDRRAASATVADGSLLVWSDQYDSGTRLQTGSGLTAYDGSGHMRFHLFGTSPIAEVQVVGPRAFVEKTGDRTSYLVVDLRTGRVVQELSVGSLPWIVGDGVAFAGD